jgi:hypothetical protein
MGGRLEVKSDIAKGSVFTVLLPASTVVQCPPAAAPVSADSTSRAAS